MTELRRRMPSASVLRLLIAALACLLALSLEWTRPDLVARFDESLRDAFIRYRVDRSPEERVAVVDIDEYSLGEIGPWPWRRGQLADLVEILIGTYGARAVGLDIVLPEPGDAEGDARLASLATHAPLTLAQILDHTPRSPALALGTLAGGRAGATDSPAATAYGYVANHAGLAEARCVGNIGYAPDLDGILRRTPALVRYQGRDYRHFAATLIACGRGHGATTAAPSVDSRGFWRLPFRRDLAAYTVIPAAEIIKEQVPAALLRGRYVLVGSSSMSLGDRVSTPLAPLSSGVMIHAASISGLLDLAEGRERPLDPARHWFVAWVLASIALALYCMPRLSAWGNVSVLSGLAAGWLALAMGGVSLQTEWSLTAPLWAYLFLLATAIPHEWWRTQRRVRRLFETFSHYVAPAVLDEILRQDSAHSLEPTLREVTVLIADMEGYTRTTSSLSLQDAADLTKEFLDCLTQPVLGQRGTLDRYTGDGLVAFWGAPLDCPDQADRAVSAALDILEKVEAFNIARRADGFAPVGVRIGIESGQALVGDLGTPFRSTYTAVGDCINFASRLEAAARDLSVSPIIGTATNRQLTRHRTRSMGKIRLRGTATDIEVFTVDTGSRQAAAAMEAAAG